MNSKSRSKAEEARLVGTALLVVVLGLAFTFGVRLYGLSATWTIYVLANLLTAILGAFRLRPRGGNFWVLFAVWVLLRSVGYAFFVRAGYPIVLLVVLMPIDYLIFAAVLKARGDRAPQNE